MKVGTRGSNLAMFQTKYVITQLSHVTDEKVDVKIIKTTGDKIKDSQLYNIDVKGIFTKELDKAVMEGEVDFAVHSLKDLPTELAGDLEIVAILPRESPREVLISPYTWEKLPPGATIGTSSLRREAFIKHHQKNLNIKPIRGNIDTRINKVLSGEYQATIMAEAGIKRLELEEHIREVFSPEYFTPPAGQGALAVVSTRYSDFRRILKGLNHYISAQEVKAEKKVLEELGVGCQWPLGVYAQALGDELHIYSIMLTPEGEVISKVNLTGPISKPENLGFKVAKAMKEDYE